MTGTLIGSKTIDQTIEQFKLRYDTRRALTASIPAELSEVRYLTDEHISEIFSHGVPMALQGIARSLLIEGPHSVSDGKPFRCWPLALYSYIEGNEFNPDEPVEKVFTHPQNWGSYNSHRGAFHLGLIHFLDEFNDIFDPDGLILTPESRIGMADTFAGNVLWLRGFYDPRSYDPRLRHQESSPPDGSPPRRIPLSEVRTSHHGKPVTVIEAGLFIEGAYLRTQSTRRLLEAAAGPLKDINDAALTAAREYQSSTGLG